MAGLNRRSLVAVGVALGAAGAAATVAAVSWLRKPEAEPVIHLAQAPPIELHNLDGLVVTDPARPVPAFSFADGAGATHDLAELRGRPVLLNLWATWCQPCIAELPALAALAHGQPLDGIAVVALSTDRGGVDQVRKFLATHQIDLPIRVDPKGDAIGLLNARGLPTTLILDRDGRERARFEGAADWASEAARQRILELAAK